MSPARDPDGTVPPVDRVAPGRPYRSGKRKHHGMNVQLLGDPAGRPIWASDALPEAVHDPTATRTHGISPTLAAGDIKHRADKAYQGAGSAVRVPSRAGVCAAGAPAAQPRSRYAATADVPWPPSNCRRLLRKQHHPAHRHRPCRCRP
ncbi:transposase family protein [Streptomyces cinereospinus]|uniref:Transposase family protein n=1 Tax=Streptomyces cinereospinus TaxID=285561 RepID=A0ABV5N5K8_9ACTN